MFSMGGGEAGHLPRDVGLPAAPGLAEMLEDGARLVLLDPLRHHVDDVVHHGGAQLQVEVALHTLFRHGLGHGLYIIVVISKASKGCHLYICCSQLTALYVM